jgi:outer membrane protein assembly factor BamB
MLPAAVVGGVAVFEYDGRVEGRRLTTGAVVWSRQTSASVVQAWEGTGVALVDDPSRPASSSCGTQASPCQLAPPPGPTAGTPADAGGTVSLLDPATGRDRWTVAVPTRPDPGASSVSTRHVVVALASATGDDETLVALDLATGKQAWRFTGKLSGTSVHGDVVAVLSSTDTNDRARALDPATGAVLWEASAEGLFREAPFVARDRSYGFQRDSRTGRALPGRVPVGYGLAGYGPLLVGADDTSLTAVDAGRPAWTAGLLQGPRPITYLDIDAHHVVSVTAVGQEVYRD